MESPPPINTPEWREWRRGGIGASDIPAIMGVGYRTEYELALEKRGQLPPQDETDAMRWGHLVEPVAIELYRELTNSDATPVNGTYIDPAWPNVYVSLDGYRVTDNIGVEVKWGSWKEPPPKVVYQALAQQAFAGLEAVDVIRVGAYGDPLITTINDPATGHRLLELAQAWYERFVLGDELPPLDGSKGASDFLNGTEWAEQEWQANVDQEIMVRNLATIRQGMDRLSRQDAALVNRIKESMVGATALKGDGWRISWKPSKPATSTNWEAIAKGYRQIIERVGEEQLGMGLFNAVLDDFGLNAVSLTEALDALASIHTTTAEQGARPFRPSGALFKKGENEE